MGQINILILLEKINLLQLMQDLSFKQSRIPEVIGLSLIFFIDSAG